MRRIRVGIVNYLNSRPLAWSFLTGRAEACLEPSYHPPAEVARLLEAGELEVGLIPSIEVQRLPGLRVLPGLCIASTHEVESVLLVSRVDIGEIRQVSVDSNSRTSAALVRILLRDRYQSRPRFVAASPDLEKMLAVSEAALLIGDPALRVDRNRYRTLDLAAEWRSLTGHPFVFAVWAVRDDLEAPGLKGWFEESLDLGMEEMEQLVDRSVDDLGLPREEVVDYLTRSLSYVLGAEERAGLEEFYRRCRTLGLLDSVCPIRFWEG